ncbi:hypothetical protein [Pseudalkalibacillus berkeleyi]|uniref:DUF4129 domain-containing protein n=1 Tax=Pseudalkalibacillus berkeleyi TaxID=1069813 RepID=A0ABS9H1L5_9BACL|nr:hypothetical protein [Pseudalkalibacillus berkeleyi]MCF6137796.1 hypothetical protein [Pseudalkalibacillus berkeleyi]
MSNFLRLRTRWLQYSMDIVFALLLSVWVFAPVHENPYLAIFSLMVIGGLMYEVLLPRIKATVGKIVFTLPVLFGIGWILGIDVLVLMLLTILIGWRFTSQYFDEDLGQEVHILLLSLASTIIFYFFFSTNDYVSFALWLLLLQTILFAIVRVNRAVLTNQNTDQAVHRWVGKVTLVLAVATASIVLLFPLIQSITMSILKGLGTIIATVLYYPISFVVTLFASFIKEGNIERVQDNVEDADLKTNEEILREMVNDSNQSEWFTYVLIALIALAVIWYGIRLYKRKLSFTNASLYNGFQENSMNLGEDFGERNIVRDRTPPANKIRKQLYRLEKKMAGYKLGRYPQESVLEWFDRIGLPSDKSNNVNHIYERVRYGIKEISAEEEEQYIETMKQLISWGKEQHKIITKEQKRKGRLDR